MAAINFQPRRGAILMCDFDMARGDPEMRKKRQAIVMSIVNLNHRHGLAPGHCTIVPTSAEPPKTEGPEDILIPVGKYWSFKEDSWVRCKMLMTISHTRLEMLLHKRGIPRVSEFIDAGDMQRIEAGIRYVLRLP